MPSFAVPILKLLNKKDKTGAVVLVGGCKNEKRWRSLWSLTGLAKLLIKKLNSWLNGGRQQGLARKDFYTYPSWSAAAFRAGCISRGIALSKEKEMTIIFERSKPFQLKPGRKNTDLMVRYWWLYFAIAFLKTPFKQFTKIESLWIKN